MGELRALPWTGTLCTLSTGTRGHCTRVRVLQLACSQATTSFKRVIPCLHDRDAATPAGTRARVESNCEPSSDVHLRIDAAAWQARHTPFARQVVVAQRLYGLVAEHLCFLKNSLFPFAISFFHNLQTWDAPETTTLDRCGNNEQIVADAETPK